MVDIESNASPLKYNPQGFSTKNHFFYYSSLSPLNYRGFNPNESPVSILSFLRPSLFLQSFTFIENSFNMRYLLPLLFLPLCFSLFAQTEVPTEANKICPILLGENLPEGKLQTLEGKSVDILEYTKGKPTILVFYRGGWCPYCNRQLAGLNAVQDSITALGFQVIAISPDKPEKLMESQEKEEVSYSLMSDASMQFSRDLGIAFELDKKTRVKYRMYGINLEKTSGYDHHQLPAPAVIVIDGEGVVQFTYINPNYKVRLNPEVLLAVLHSMQ